MKTNHKVKKATLREKLVKLALNIARNVSKKIIDAVDGTQQREYFMSGIGWSGFVTPSVWMQCTKPGRSKYVPHQGFQEKWRRKCQ